MARMWILATPLVDLIPLERSRPLLMGLNPVYSTGFSPCRAAQPDIGALVCEMAVLSIKRAGSQSDSRRANMEAYVEWLLTPKGERAIQTKTLFAEDLGVTTQSLRNYSRDPWVQSEMLKRGRAINKVERAGDVVSNLYSLATNESGETPASTQVSAGKAFLEWTEKTVADMSAGDLQDMSIDDLREVLDDLERKILA